MQVSALDKTELAFTHGVHVIWMYTIINESNVIIRI